MLRLALIGCGDIVNRYYLPALKELQSRKKVCLRACCDLNAQKADFAAKEGGFERSYTDWKKMMEEEEPDAVLAAVPVEHTADLVIEMTKMGIPVMLEKPPALTISKAMELREALMERNVLYQVAFNRHFMPLVISLKNRLKEQGRVQNIQIQMCRVERLEPTFYTTAIHSIDLLKFLADSEYEHVDFRYQDLKDRGEHVSNFYLNCIFQNGITGQITILVDSGIINERIMATCRGTTFYASLPVWECSDSPGEIIEYQKDGVVAREGGAKEAGYDVASGFYGEIDNFLQAVEQKRQPEENMDYAMSLIDIARKLHERAGEWNREDRDGNETGNQGKTAACNG